MVARFAIRKQTLLIMIPLLLLSLLKRRQSKLLQYTIINADTGDPDLFNNWFFGGNSTVCIGVETYYA